MKVFWYAWFVIILSQVALIQLARGSNYSKYDLMLTLAQKLRRVDGSYEEAFELYQTIITEANEQSHAYKRALLDAAILLESRPHMSLNTTSLFLLLRASSVGVAEAQSKIASAFSTGLYYGLFPFEEAKSILLDQVASRSGNVMANMAMGYRYYYGHGVVASCMRAKRHYEFVANIVASVLSKRGVLPFVHKNLLADVDALPSIQTLQLEVEGLEFFEHCAREQDISCIQALTRTYLLGSLFTTQNIEKALDYAYQGAILNDVVSAGLLSYFYVFHDIFSANSDEKSELLEAQERFYDNDFELDYEYPFSSFRKEPFEKNKTMIRLTPTEINHFIKLSFTSKDVHGTIAYALSSCYGLFSIPKNSTLAFELLSALSLSSSAASYFAGELISGNLPSDLNVDMNAAYQFYSIGAQTGSILATHRKAQIESHSLPQSSCEIAVAGFKLVAEYGDWMYGMSRAYRLYSINKLQDALMLYARYASAGVEVAQFNTAYILSKMLEQPVNPFRRKFSPLESHHPSASKKWLEESTESFVEDPYFFSDSKDALIKWNKKLLTTSEFLDMLFRRTATDRSTTSELPKTVSLSPIYDGVKPTETCHSSSSMASNSDNKDSICSTKTHNLNSSILLKEFQMRIYDLHSHASSQGNAASLLAVGDMHYYGEGPFTSNKAKAVACYQKGADLKRAKAMFNLAIMFQLGDGVPQDLHLAKRFYDKAAVVDPLAISPSSLAVALLSLHGILNHLFGTEQVNEWILYWGPRLSTWLLNLQAWALPSLRTSSASKVTSVGVHSSSTYSSSSSATSSTSSSSTTSTASSSSASASASAAATSSSTHSMKGRRDSSTIKSNFSKFNTIIQFYQDAVNCVLIIVYSLLRFPLHQVPMVDLFDPWTENVFIVVLLSIIFYILDFLKRRRARMELRALARQPINMNR